MEVLSLQIDVLVDFEGAVSFSTSTERSFTTANPEMKKTVQEKLVVIAKFFERKQLHLSNNQITILSHLENTFAIFKRRIEGEGEKGISLYEIIMMIKMIR